MKRILLYSMGMFIIASSNIIQAISIEGKKATLKSPEEISKGIDKSLQQVRAQEGEALQKARETGEDPEWVKKLQEATARRKELQANLKKYEEAYNQYSITSQEGYSIEAQAALRSIEGLQTEIAQYAKQLGTVSVKPTSEPGSAFYSEDFKVFQGLTSKPKYYESKTNRDKRLINLQTLAVNLIEKASSRASAVLGTDFQDTKQTLSNAMKKITTIKPDPKDKKTTQELQKVNQATNAALFDYVQEQGRTKNRLGSLESYSPGQKRGIIDQELTKLNEKYAQVYKAISDIDKNQTAKLPAELSLDSLRQFAGTAKKRSEPSSIPASGGSM